METNAREYLLVDGHSIVFGWPELRSLHARRMMTARDALIKRLTAYQDQSGVGVVLVFDGRGARASEESEPGGIQVFYAPASQSADNVIERLVAKYGGSCRLTVASSDHLVQQTSITFGATHCLNADQLKSMLEAVERDFSRQSRLHRRV